MSTQDGEGLRKRRQGFFVQVPRDTIRDSRLSWKARGLLAYLLDMPEGWDVRSEALARSGSDGKDSVQSGLRELRRYGYYRLERRRLLDGRIVMGTAISETAVPDWVAEFTEFQEGPVLVVQQRDRTFKVRHADGSLTDDGFIPDDLSIDAATGAGFPGAGETGPGSPGVGKTGAGESRPIRDTDTGEATTGEATTGEATRTDLVTADAATPGLALVSEVVEDRSPQFEDFWQVYPRHVGKQDARKSWDKAVRTATAAVVMAGAVRYRDDPNRPHGDQERQLIPHPATWLNQGRWEDEPCPPRIGRTAPSNLYVQHGNRVSEGQSW